MDTRLCDELFHGSERMDLVGCSVHDDGGVHRRPVYCDMEILVSSLTSLCASLSLPTGAEPLALPTMDFPSSPLLL